MDLTIDRLTKQFGSKIAVDRVSTRLTPGVYGLLGANGAGKTTLMRMVCDVLRPTSGEIRFDGRDVRLLGDEYRARLGYLPQDFGYYPDFSALDFMCYLAALKGLDRRAARRRSLELLETVGLADVARQKVRTFSGGMKQRLGIAQAVLNDPAVLVLDEPTSGLDPLMQNRFIELVLEEKARGKTILLSSHMFEEVERTCDRVGILRQGKLAAVLVLDEPTAGLDPKERVRFRNLIASFAQDKIVILSTHIVSDVEYIADEILVMRAGAFIMQGAPTDIVATVTGKVWECHVDARRADELAAASCVSNVHYAADGHAVVRVVADEAPVAGARALDPTLEDVYLYVFRDEVVPLS